CCSYRRRKAFCTFTTKIPQTSSARLKPLRRNLERKPCRLIRGLTTFSSRLRISIRRPLRRKSSLTHSQHRNRATLECSYTADRVIHLVLFGCPSSPCRRVGLSLFRRIPQKTTRDSRAEGRQFPSLCSGQANR